MSTYDAQTINARNPIARFAHRNRIARSLSLSLPLLGDGKLLDYGCGSGVLVAALLDKRPGCAVGYEPFMTERVQGEIPIFKTHEEVERQGPFQLITLFETIEHLSSEELDTFLQFSASVLAPSGGILISGPIEIGPAVIVKDLNRFALRGKPSEHGTVELLKAALLGIPARRAENIKNSHRGFDFRKARRDLLQRGWLTDVLSYGPMPIRTWYGNSQVYLWAHRA
jgi:2-polyprenyl-3-methyl-5-hydroxy-6-metoxy-1,4-benzoquinol methylase